MADDDDAVVVEVLGVVVEVVGLVVVVVVVEEDVPPEEEFDFVDEGLGAAFGEAAAADKVSVDRVPLSSAAAVTPDCAESADVPPPPPQDASSMVVMAANDTVCNERRLNAMLNMELLPLK